MTAPLAGGVGFGELAPGTLIPKKLVVQPSEAPAGSKLLYSGAKPAPGDGPDQVPAGTGTWHVRFSKGTSLVLSDAFVFPSVSAAKAFLMGGLRAQAEDRSWVSLPDPSLGDFSRAFWQACTGPGCPKGGGTAYAAIRKGRVVLATIVSMTGARQPIVDELLTLAREQAQRIGTG